jgi:hypothetical protein
MNSISKNLRLTNDLIRPLLYAGGLIVAYVILVFVLPVSEADANYQLAPLQHRIVRLAVAIPGLLAWLAAFAGYGMLRQYTGSIKQAAESLHFERLTKGAGWLAWSLPLSALTALILNGLANKWADFHVPAVIIGNYVNLLLPLVAFSLIGTGTRGLISGARLKLNLGNARLIMFLFLVLGVTFCLFTFRQLDAFSLGSSDNPYYLPIWLIVLTIIVPYLYAWFVGLLAAYEIALYSKQINGVLYRQALRLLAGGLIIVIGGFIGLQYLRAVQLVSGHLVLDYRILLVWLFRLISIAGFVMLLLGVYRLKKIEEV